jgi:putative membrane protein insertion efficiency factor
MQQKIQPSGGGSQSCAPSFVGEFQTAAAPPAEQMHNAADSQAQAQDIFKAADDERDSSLAGGCRHCGKKRCGIAAGVVISLIRVYQRFISPRLPDCCRFEPSCSRYAVQSFEMHGFWIGMVLTSWRILRCQPLCKGGFDPVPERPFRKKKQPRRNDEI